jgi:hypothetical protein
MKLCLYVVLSSKYSKRHIITGYGPLRLLACNKKEQLDLLGEMEISYVHKGTK